MSASLHGKLRSRLSGLCTTHASMFLASVMSKHKLDMFCEVPVFKDFTYCYGLCNTSKDKGKGFPYSLPSVGPGADPGVKAVSLSSTRR